MTKLIAIIAALLQIVPATRTISGEVYRIDYPTGTQDAPIVPSSPRTATSGSQMTTSHRVTRRLRSHSAPTAPRT